MRPFFCEKKEEADHGDKPESRRGADALRRYLPKHWKAEAAQIEQELPNINQRWNKEVIDLAMGEVIDHNRARVERAERMPRETEHSRQEQTVAKKRLEKSL